MINIKKIAKQIILGALTAVAILSMASCDDGKSYSDLLREEEVAVNRYLALNQVETRVPADSVFIEG